MAPPAPGRNQSAAIDSSVSASPQIDMETADSRKHPAPADGDPVKRRREETRFPKPYTHPDSRTMEPAPAAGAVASTNKSRITPSLDRSSRSQKTRTALAAAKNKRAPAGRRLTGFAGEAFDLAGIAAFPAFTIKSYSGTHGGPSG